MTGRTRYKFLFILLVAGVVELLFWTLAGIIWYSVSNFLPTLRIHHPQWIWLMVVLPFCSVLFVMTIYSKNRILSRLAEPSLIPYLVPDLSTLRTTLKYVLLRITFGLLVVALIDPKIGTRLEEVKSEGIDIMIALDVSNSMLAEDAAPNRLERARYSISQLLKNLHGDRVGLVVFAGNAYVQMPITNDYEAAKLFLSTIDTKSIHKQGTAIGNAINLCLESFDDQSKANKVIMVITDGENHEDDAIEAARRASEQHQVIVHTIGVGSPEGTLIPILGENGAPAGFKKDAGGTPVVTALNESLLRDIASAGKGTFTRVVNTSSSLTDIVKNIESLEKVELNKKQFADYEHRYGWFLLPAILLLAIEQLIAARKGKWSSTLNFIE